MENHNFIAEFSASISNDYVIYILTERRNAMSEIPNIILALIGQTPWFVIAYIVYKVYSNKPKHTSISIPDKVTITSER